MSNVKLLPLYSELQGHPKIEIIKHYALACIEADRKARPYIDMHHGGPIPAPIADDVARLVEVAHPAPRNRTEAAALARIALAHLGLIDAYIDAAIARCETNLAQPQGEG